MASNIEAYSLLVNKKMIPIKAGTLEYDFYMAKKKTTPVVFSGSIRQTYSENLEETQMVKFDIPEFFEGIDVSSALLNAMKLGGDVTLYKKGVKRNYIDCCIVEFGQFKDDGENFAPVTIKGVFQTKSQ